MMRTNEELMTATQEKVLEDKTVEELAEYLSENWESVRNALVHSPARLDRLEVAEIVRWIRSWRQRQPGNEELRAGMLALLIAYFVEWDIEKRFDKVFADK